MKKTWKLAMICMAIASVSLMAGCGDDNNPDNPEEGEIDNPVVSNPEEPDGSLQEPEKAKAKINEVGKELVSMVNANDFKDLATIADALSALSDEPYYGYENADYQHRASNLIAATRGDMDALYALSRTKLLNTTVRMNMTRKKENGYGQKELLPTSSFAASQLKMKS